jgi:hypothetical protein
MPLAVVLDSNIWLSEQMLRHSAGAAVRFYLHRHDAHIAVPEVVRREVVLHLAERMKELAAEARAAHRALMPLTGRLRELVLPDDAELEGTAARAFEDIRVPIVDVPFSLESARASLRNASEAKLRAVRRISSSRTVLFGPTACALPNTRRYS